MYNVQKVQIFTIKPTAQRSVRDAEQIEKEEESRRQLEKKAEMYEKLQRDDGEDDRFLVDFGRYDCPKRQ